MRILVRRSVLAVGVTGLALLVTPVPGAQAAPPPADIVVDDSPTPCQTGLPTFTTIQAGVDAAAPGDVVRVCPGSYPEYVTVNKTLVLRGPKWGVTGWSRSGTGGEAVIDPPDLPDPAYIPPGVTLNADGIVFDGFLVQGVVENAGIYTTPAFSGYQIRNNRVRNNVFGVYLHSGGAVRSMMTGNYVSNNNVPGAANGNGVYADQGSVNLSIVNNRFALHQNSGVLFADGGQPTSNIEVRSNVFRNENWAHMFFFRGSNISIVGNRMSNAVADPAGGTSLLLTNVTGVVVKANTITRAHFSGIAVRAGADDVDLLYNKVTRAGGTGIDVTSDVPGAVTVVGNLSKDNGGDGILMGSATSGGVLRSNRGYGNGGYDCHDESTGAERGGVANFWALDNRGVTDQPSVLCRP